MLPLVNKSLAIFQWKQDIAQAEVLCAEALEIDPHDSDHWLYGTGLTLYGGHDLTKWDSSNASEKVSIASLAYDSWMGKNGNE